MKLELNRKHEPGDGRIIRTYYATEVKHGDISVLRTAVKSARVNGRRRHWMYVQDVHKDTAIISIDECIHGHRQ